MARAAPSAPALSGAEGACAITKQEDSPPPGYNEVVQDRRKIRKTVTRDVDIERAENVKKGGGGCCSRTMIVFKIILVLMLLASFGLVILITYRQAIFDWDFFWINKQVENLQRRQGDLYSTIHDMEKRLNSHHPTTTPRPFIRPAQSHGFRNDWRVRGW